MGFKVRGMMVSRFEILHPRVPRLSLVRLLNIGWALFGLEFRGLGV